MTNRGRERGFYVPESDDFDAALDAFESGGIDLCEEFGVAWHLPEQLGSLGVTQHDDWVAREHDRRSQHGNWNLSLLRNRGEKQGK